MRERDVREPKHRILRQQSRHVGIDGAGKGRRDLFNQLRTHRRISRRRQFFVRSRKTQFDRAVPRVLVPSGEFIEWAQRSGRIFWTGRGYSAPFEACSNTRLESEIKFNLCQRSLY